MGSLGTLAGGLRHLQTWWPWKKKGDWRLGSIGIYCSSGGLRPVYGSRSGIYCQLWKKKGGLLLTLNRGTSFCKKFAKQMKKTWYITFVSWQMRAKKNLRQQTIRWNVEPLCHKSGIEESKLNHCATKWDGCFCCFAVSQRSPSLPRWKRQSPSSPATSGHFWMDGKWPKNWIIELQLIWEESMEGKWHNIAK